MAVDSMAFKEYEINLECVKGKTKFDCWEKISRLQADMMTLEAGDLYYAGRHFSIIPIMREQYDNCKCKTTDLNSERPCRQGALAVVYLYSES